LRATSYPRVVISLTTIPERLPHLRPTLESLLYHQSYVADTVYLVLPKQNYYSKQPLIYEPWPDFLTHMLMTTNLEILQPPFDYGPATKVLFTLDEEKPRLEDLEEQAEDKRTALKQNTPSTRIVYLDDDVWYHHNLVRVLVDASLEADGDVVALSGAMLRNKFRQVKHSDLIYDKPPNLYMHISAEKARRPSEWQKVDLVQGFTAVCVPATMDTRAIHDLLGDPAVPTSVVKSDDVVLSAAMELQNMTRWIVPGGVGSRVDFTNSSQIQPLSKGMHNNLMESVFYLQQRWNVWQEYVFLDLKQLTQKQRDAIDCEASYKQDCLDHVCWPSSTKCPEARAILEELTWKDDESRR
jgi:hypothetical protein